MPGIGDDFPGLAEPAVAAPEPPPIGRARKPRASHIREASDDDQPDPILRNKDGHIQACEHNAFTLMSRDEKFDGLFFDDFLQRARIGARDWIDGDLLDAQRWLQRTHRVAGFSKNHTNSAVMSLAMSRTRDTLIDFIDGLKWDGIPRIEQAFIDAWGCNDTEVTRAASHHFFVALAARAYLPGAQVDTLWAFEGAQGTGKSQALRALGGEFHSEISASIGTTDFQRELRGMWIAELAEMDSLRGKESSTVKRLLSAPEDRFVEKWQINAMSYKRRAVAVATTNETSGYWQDPTGARRLVPLKTGTIDVNLIRENRLQWFAEAAVAYKRGDNWWLWPESINGEQQDRQQADPWEDLLRNGLAHGRREGSVFVSHWPEGFISSATIATEWLKLDASQQGPSMSKRFGAVMRKIGFEQAKQGRETRGWLWAGPESIERTFRSSNPQASIPT